MTQTMTRENTSGIFKVGFFHEGGSTRPHKMLFFVQIHNNHCQDNFSMFFSVSIKKTAAASMAPYINGGSQKISLPCLHHPTGEGARGNPQAPSRQPLRLNRQVLPEPGLGSPFLHHAKLFQADTEYPFTRSHLVVLIAPVLVYLKQLLCADRRPPASGRTAPEGSSR
jgi:hypothetical protein